MLSLKFFTAATAALTLFSGASAGVLKRTEEPAQPSCVDFTPFTYAGCWQEPASSRTLLYSSQLSTQNMTVEKCVAFCKGNDYRYAGLEYYGQCFCGASVYGSQIEESKCNFPCSGNKTQVCGGNNIISVYQDPTFVSVNQTDVSDYKPIGCYTEGVNVRSLAWRQNQVNASSLTVEKCLSACKSGGYPFSGVEYGQECWCGVVLGNGTVPTTGCDIKCTGNSAQTCGGRSRLNLFVAKDLESLEPCKDAPPVPPVTSTTISTSSTTTSSSTSSTTTSATSSSSTSSSTESSTSTTSPSSTSSTTASSTSTTSSSSTSSTASSTSTTSSSSTSSTDSSTSTTSSSSTSTTASSTSTTSSSSTSSTDSSTSTTSSSSTSTTASSTSTTSSSSTTSTTAPTYPPTTTSTSPATTSSTTSPTISTSTTSKPTTSSTSTTASLCTSTVTVPLPTPTCEYKCGKWCSKPLPTFDTQPSCFTAQQNCAVQIASCFLYAGWPENLRCFEFADWCKKVTSYCNNGCQGGKKCSKGGCTSQYPPSGPAPSPTATVSTSVYTCKPTTTLKPVTTTSKTPTSTTVIPIPTCNNICTQPHNPKQGYSYDSPVGDIPIPCLTCNNVYPEYNAGYPFKLYNSPDSDDCPSYGRGGNKGPNKGCKDACDNQYSSCMDTYAEGCKGNRFADSYSKGSKKCRDQRDDCYEENSRVSAGNKCQSWNSGWTR